MKSKSPYVADDQRLADVVAAIQVMGISGNHMRSFREWSEAITGAKDGHEHWKAIFIQHPEFFRLDTTRSMASLVWRRQLAKRYHVEREEMLPIAEMAGLDKSERGKISRSPLSPADIKTLIDTAINLHSRAVDFRRELRWWVPLVAALVGALVGVLLKK